MKQRHLLLALAIGASVLALSACNKDDAQDAAAPAAAPKGETADQFIARVNQELRKMYPEITASQWLSNTYINDDSQLLEAKYNERYLAQLNVWIEQARKFEGQQMSPETARAIQLLKLSTAMPAPKDPAKLEELTKLASKMGGMYGAGKYCTGEGDAKKCRDLGNWKTCCAAAATTTRNWMPGRAGTPSPSRCARTTPASPNWSMKAPRNWVTPTPAKCGAAATT